MRDLVERHETTIRELLSHLNRLRTDSTGDLEDPTVWRECGVVVDQIPDRFSLVHESLGLSLAVPMHIGLRLT